MTDFNRVTLIFAISLFIPFGAQADSWSCRLGNDVREVYIEQTSSAPAPCQVIYRKLTEGVEDQVLWDAQHDAAYCEEKAGAFVSKLEGWDWTCVETIRDSDAQ